MNGLPLTCAISPGQKIQEQEEESNSPSESLIHFPFWGGLNCQILNQAEKSNLLNFNLNGIANRMVTNSYTANNKLKAATVLLLL